jgi:hypothetical protein
MEIMLPLESSVVSYTCNNISDIPPASFFGLDFEDEDCRFPGNVSTCPSHYRVSYPQRTY